MAQLKRTPNIKTAGRPCEYKFKYNRVVYRLALLGATHAEMAEILDIAIDTLYKWKKAYPKFADAIKAGGADADARVVEALYKRAIGYQHKAVDIKAVEGRIVQTGYTKQYPPDTSAAYLWLKNRRSITMTRRPRIETGMEEELKEESLVWRDKIEQEVTTTNLTPSQNHDERARATREALLKELNTATDKES